MESSEPSPAITRRGSLAALLAAPLAGCTGSRLLDAVVPRDTYQAREGQHDDLVLATALACWFRGWFCQYLDAVHAERERNITHVAV